MAPRSDGRYIEPMPRFRRGSVREYEGGSGSSSRTSRQRSHTHSGVGPSHYASMGAPPPPPPLPPFPLPDPYHHLAIPHHPNHGQTLSPWAGQTHLNPPPRPYSPGWEQWKSDLSHRFGFSGVNYIVPPPSHLSRHTGGGAPRSMVPSNPSEMTKQIGKFGMWIGSHGKHYSSPGRVTDIAGRLSHNLPDFADLFIEVVTRKKARSFLPSSTGEDLYQRGLEVLRLYRSNMAGHNIGPLERWSKCTTSQRAHAQNVITEMLVYNYDNWDGFLWHVINWINSRRVAHS
ncbi:hypothetical protein GGR51DRAFT_574725 [Nemania sp. FL0031]|nr:hypothetical protein GGR51DRAFT_574725 [Nemania sp. FL0031]